MALGSLLGGGLALFAGMSAKSDAKRIGKLNMRSIEEQTTEDIRRLGRETDYTLGTARAQMGASGLSSKSASFKSFIAEQQAEAGRQMAFIRKAGDTQKQLAKAGAASAGRQAMYQGIQGFISGVSGFMGGGK